MGLDLDYEDGQTPIDEDEKEGLLINKGYNKPYFTWGSRNLIKAGEARSQYLNALREADKLNYIPLIEFARL